MRLLQPASPGSAFEPGEIIGGQDRGGIAADGKERAVPQGHLAGIPHQEAQAHDHDGVIDCHGELRQAVLRFRRAHHKLRAHHHDREQGEGKNLSEAVHLRLVFPHRI